jgi:class 3 adenylate cyclase
LKELGVGPLGHRRKLLDAISALRAGDVPSPGSATTPPSTPPATKMTASEVAGERRHVTVMFCDLVDSTGKRHHLAVEPV